MNRSIVLAALAALAVGFGGMSSTARMPGTEVMQTDSKAKFDAIVERYEKAQKEFMTQLKATKREEQQEFYKKRPGPEFLPEFKALAKESRGSDVAVKCWLRIAQLGGQFGKPDEVKGAIDTLMSDYVKSPALEDLPMLLGQFSALLGAEKAEHALRDLAAQSPHKNVQAGATYALAEMLFEGSKPGSPQAKEARTLFEKVIADFGDVKSNFGTTYKSMAEGVLFEMDHLQVGMQAPDFEAIDENGVKFKLSDYKGKVVIVDFWGFW